MDLQERIRRLERGNRLLTAALVAIAAVTGAALLVGAAAPSEIPDRIAAREFVLIDEHGKERAALRMVHRDFGTGTGEGPQLILNDFAERPRLRLAFEETSNGNEKIELEMLDTKDLAQLALKYDPDGIQGAWSTISLRGTRSQVYLLATPGDARVQLRDDPARYATGVQLFATSYARGLEIERLEVGDIRGSLLHPEIRLIRDKDGARISLHDNNGDPIWSKP